MTPEERRERDINALRAAFVGVDITTVTEALVECYDPDALVRLIVDLKHELSVPVEPGEMPGHGIWKPREHDPNEKVAKLEVECNQFHGDPRTRVPHTHVEL
jgi:hypothetical protein